MNRYGARIAQRNEGTICSHYVVILSLSWLFLNQKKHYRQTSHTHVCQTHRFTQHALRLHINNVLRTIFWVLHSVATVCPFSSVKTACNGIAEHIKKADHHISHLDCIKLLCHTQQLQSIEYNGTDIWRDASWRIYLVTTNSSGSWKLYDNMAPQCISYYSVASSQGRTSI